MRQRMTVVVTVLCMLAGMLSACAAPTTSKYTTYSMDYFDTVTTITGYADSREAFDATAGEALAMLEQYHRLYTIYHRYDGLENLCSVNELVDGAHRTVTVDRRIIDLLLYARQMHTLTDGVMNVAMGSVLSLWHDYRTIGKDNPAVASLPPMDRLQAAAAHTDITKVLIDEQSSTVTLTDPQMKLDVGALAKGYATERVAQALEEQGVSGYVLNVGGNVRTVGSKGDGTPWTVGVENPEGGDYLAYLELSGMSLVTSGSYQRFYYVDGKAYHHIIHPDTLMPAEGHLSVSVVCRHAGMADALSTALFCMPQAEGLQLIDSIPEAEAMWVTDAGERSYSAGWHQYEKE